ncbi:MAG: site-specific DNA-methyltransferase [Eubacteriales bacterium]|nr:site-specific DNA-methyltransferase [Eubacteriales bacterium]
MRFEKRQLKDLKPAEYNPRVELHPGDPEFERIARSIEEFGYADPIIINADNTIIGGHQRCNVMMACGIEEVDVVVLDLSKEKEKGLNIALNKITGKWDEDKLKDLLINLDEIGFDITLTGFERSELDDLVLKIDHSPTAEDDGFDPESMDAAVGEEAVTKLGDVWILGRHRLLCGDATNENDMRRLMGGAEARLIVTDPPYNVAYGDKVSSNPDLTSRERVKSETGDDIRNDKMEDEEFSQFLDAVFFNIYGAAASGAAIYVFHSDSMGERFRRSFREAGVKLAECLIWEKNTFVLGRQDYQWKHEPILYGWKTGSGHYFVEDRSQDTILKNDMPDLESMDKEEILAWIREENPYTTIQYEAKPNRSELHPTMKPVPLVGRLIANSSKPNWTVLDPFSGSGTTLIACEQTQRTCYGMEMSPHYCDIIIKRWEDLTGQKAVRANE